MQLEGRMAVVVEQRMKLFLGFLSLIWFVQMRGQACLLFLLVFQYFLNNRVVEFIFVFMGFWQDMLFINFVVVLVLLNGQELVGRVLRGFCMSFNFIVFQQVYIWYVKVVFGEFGLGCVFQMWNNSKLFIRYMWGKISDCYIIEVEFCIGIIGIVWIAGGVVICLGLVGGGDFGVKGVCVGVFGVL